jgi:hypothetical protein
MRTILVLVLLTILFLTIVGPSSAGCGCYRVARSRSICARDLGGWYKFIHYRESAGYRWQKILSVYTTKPARGCKYVSIGAGYHAYICQDQCPLIR